MSPPMEFGKDEEDSNCLDRISSLPDELLGRVLSFLPTKIAVSTSILSTRWRYLFTLTTCLCFDNSPCFGHPQQNERIESNRTFEDFVDKVLELHQISPIKKFSLVCKDVCAASDFNRWFSNVLQKGVQELHCDVSFLSGDCMPDYDGFFTSETLVNLKMRDCWRYKIKIPLSASLPNLKMLHLKRIKFFDFMSMERLFSSCKLLVELTFISCECETSGHVIHNTGMLKVLTIERCSFWLGTYEIDAPNLSYLTYISNIGVKIVPSWKYSSSFVRAELTFIKYFAYDDSVVDEDSAVYDRELLEAAAHKVTKLCFKKDSVQILLPLDAGKQMPDFYILSRLYVPDCPYDAWQYVTNLISKSPKLETVVFGDGFRCCICQYVFCRRGNCYCDRLSPSDIPLNPFSCYVQVIEVHEFCRHKGSLSLMGHLLRNAIFLKRLTVYAKGDLEDEQGACKKLLKLPKASRDCSVEIKKRKKNCLIGDMEF